MRNQRSPIMYFLLGGLVTFMGFYLFLNTPDLLGKFLASVALFCGLGTIAVGFMNMEYFTNKFMLPKKSKVTK